MKKMTPEELEKFIHQQLRGLPAHRAPGSLESRVSAAIEQRAMIPWYHRSWSYWPPLVRSFFLALAMVVTSGVITAFYLMARGVDTNAMAASAGSRLAIFTQTYNAAEWIVDFASRTMGSIPSLWLYSGMAILAALYAAFFGLGAAAYRTLYRRN